MFDIEFLMKLELSYILPVEKHVGISLAVMPQNNTDSMFPFSTSLLRRQL